MNMREKIARAICASAWTPPYSKMALATIEVHWKNYLVEAGAALDALREPTEGMINAGDDSRAKYELAIDIWSIMIDAAREGKS